MKCTDTLEQSSVGFVSLELFCLLGKKKGNLWVVFFFFANADIGLIHTDTFGMIIL